MSSSNNNEAGLFSASLTAFIIQSYPTLTPNNTDTMVILLERISQQLAAMSNASVSASATTIVAPAPFVPPASAIVCNVLWFLSLGFSLACALSATLVEQWARNYLLATESRPIPHERARVFEYLYKGLEKFRMASVVEAIPMLLHISLFLFFVGLVEFLRPVNFVISMIIFGMLISCIMIYILVTVIPAFQRNCPYCTPLSRLFWSVMKALHVLHRWDPASGGTVEIVGSMAQARELEATEISPQRDQRDLDAMCWTLKALRDDTELEAFIEMIPQVVAGFDYSAKLLLYKLLCYDDFSVRLDHRISRLLLTCAGGLLGRSVSQKRATTCLAAIWSLTIMSIVSGSSSISSISSSRALRFGEQTLRDMAVVKVTVPGAADYVISAMAVVARAVLDMYLSCVAENEQTLSALSDVRGGVWHRDNVPQHHQMRHEYVQILNAIHRRTRDWERHLRPGEEPVSMTPFVILSYLDHDLTKLVSIATAHAEDPNLATETLELLRDFRAKINQLGFCLTVEYAANFLDSRSLPFEAFNTIRRLFLRIDFAGYISVESQRRLVVVLDDALEPDSKGEIRTPESIVNIMLGLTTAVKDQTCAIKAMNIISRNMKFFPSEDAAHKALSVLSDAIPRLTPTLDLFRLHMYANTKLDQSNR
jgi:Family of unknown function (DUF6535)